MKTYSSFSDTYTSQDNNAIYLGCDGTYQALLRKINCKSDGRDCSEIKSWKKNFDEQMNEFRGCVGSQTNDVTALAPAQCRSVGSTPNKPCSGKKFWDYAEITAKVQAKDICKKEVDDAGTEDRITYLFKSEHCTELECSNVWSHWESYNKTDDCAWTNPFLSKLKFCRQSKNKNCVIAEANYKRCDTYTGEIQDMYVERNRRRRTWSI